MLTLLTLQMSAEPGGAHEPRTQPVTTKPALSETDAAALGGAASRDGGRCSDLDLDIGEEFLSPRIAVLRLHVVLDRLEDLDGHPLMGPADNGAEGAAARKCL